MKYTLHILGTQKMYLTRTQAFLFNYPKIFPKTLLFQCIHFCLSLLLCDWLHLTEFLFVLQRRASPRRRPNPRYRWTTPGRGHIAPAGYQHPAAGAWPGRAGDRTSEIIRAWSIFVTCVHYPDLACGSALTFGYVGHIQGGIRHGGEWKYIHI